MVGFRNTRLWFLRKSEPRLKLMLVPYILLIGNQAGHCKPATHVQGGSRAHLAVVRQRNANLALNIGLLG